MADKIRIAIVDDDITTEVDFDKVRAAMPNFEITIFRSVSSFIETLDAGQDFDVVSSDLNFSNFRDGSYADIIVNICNFPEARQKPNFFIHSRDIDFAQDSIKQSEALVGDFGTELTIGSYFSNVWQKLEHGLYGEPNDGLDEDQLRTTLIELSERAAEASSSKRLSIAICDDDIATYADFERIRADFSELDITIFRTWNDFTGAMNTGARFDVISSEFDLSKPDDEITRLPQLVRWIANLPAEQQPSSFFAHSKDVLNVLSRCDKEWQNEALDEIQGADFDDVDFTREVYHTAAWRSMGNFGRNHLAGNHEEHPLFRLLKTHVKEAPKPAPKEPEKKYLWLMIDDDINSSIANIESISSSLRPNAAVVVARNLEQAYEHLERWEGLGIYPDYIDADLYIELGEDKVLSGSEALLAIHGWLKSNVPDFDASNHRFMMHSKQPSFNSGIIDFEVAKYDVWEWRSVGNQVRQENGEHYVDAHMHNQFSIRKFLNRIIGERRFPESAVEVAIKESPYTTVRVSDAPKIVADGVIEADVAIAKLDFDDATDCLQTTADLDNFSDRDRDGAPEFEISFGQDICGVAVFDEAGIDRVIAEGETPILIMESFLPNDTWLLSKVGGVVLVGDGTEHLEVVVANHGITALTAPEIRSGFEYSTDGYINWQFAGYSYNISDGDKVTCRVSRITGAENDFAGDLFKGETTIEEATISGGSTAKVFGWANQARVKYNGLGIQANVDTPVQIAKAIELGLEGAGLVRTEHMFQNAEGLEALREVVLNGSDIRNFVDFGEHQYQEILPMFEAANQAEKGFPLSIRLLDAPPSNEFFEPEQIAKLGELHGQDNVRGAQLATSITGLYRAQSEAIFRAYKESGSTNELEITIPLIRTADELKSLKTEIEQAAGRHGMKGQYKLRAMIETVSACEDISAIAKEVDGISYGTNDLTQETMGGTARNDLVATRDWMADNGHVGKSPWHRLSKPVRELMRTSSEAARAANPNIDICVCGQQVDSDIESTGFCHEIGVDSISVPANVQSAYTSQLIAGRKAIETPREKEATVEAAAVIDFH